MVEGLPQQLGKEEPQASSGYNKCTKFIELEFIQRNLLFLSLRYMIKCLKTWILMYALECQYLLDMILTILLRYHFTISYCLRFIFTKVLLNVLS